jgi:hypothetical protein
MTFYWKVCKDFLDYIEDSMSHDSLIGSTISTRSKKSISCASKMSSTSVLSHDTKASKVFEENQNYVGDEEFHQEPDHPSTFMKMVKERTENVSCK